MRNGNEGSRNVRDEVFFRSLEDSVQPPAKAKPGEGPFNQPANAGRNKPPVAASGDRLDGDAERFTNFGQSLALVTKIAQRRPLETTIGDYSLRVSTPPSPGERERSVEGAGSSRRRDNFVTL